MSTGELNAGQVIPRWTSIPSRGSKNTPSRFMLQNHSVIRPDLMDHLAYMQTIDICKLKFHTMHQVINNDSICISKVSWMPKGSDSAGRRRRKGIILSFHCRLAEIKLIKNHALFYFSCPDLFLSQFAGWRHTKEPEKRRNYWSEWQKLTGKQCPRRAWVYLKIKKSQNGKRVLWICLDPVQWQRKLLSLGFLGERQLNWLSYIARRSK